MSAASATATPTPKAIKDPILDAIKEGDIEFFKTAAPNLISNYTPQQKANIFISSCTGDIPHKSLELTKFIFEKLQPDPERTLDNGSHAYIIACCAGNLEIVQYLETVIDSEVLREKTVDGQSAIYSACGNGRLEVVKHLTEAQHFDINDANEEGYSCFAIACQRGAFDVAKYLAETAKCDTYRAAQNGVNAFYFACQSGELGIAQWLYIGGKGGLPLCGIKIALTDGRTPLYGASLNGHIDVARWLVETVGLDPEQRAANGTNALWIAVSHGQMSVIRYLIEERHCSLDPSPSGAGALPLLVAAIINKQLDAAKYLIEKAGVDKNQIVAGDQLSVFCYACYTGDLATVKYLAEEAKCTTDFLGANDCTPVFVAAQQGNLEVCKYLVDTVGLNPDLPLKDGSNAFWIAVHRQHLEIVKFLYETGLVDTSAKTISNGANAFYIACQNGDLEMAKYLADTVAVETDVKLTTCGATPFFIAAQMGHVHICQWLEERMGDKLGDPFQPLTDGTSIWIASASNIKDEHVRNVTMAYLGALWGKRHRGTIIKYTVLAGVAIGGAVYLFRKWRGKK